MKLRTLNSLVTLRRQIDSLAERLDMRGEEEAVELLTGFSEELGDLLKEQPRYRERIEVRFHHDQEESS